MQRTRLRKIRIERGLTLTEVADHIGIFRSSLGNIETGRRNPSLKVAIALEKFYGIPISELLQEDDEE